LEGRHEPLVSRGDFLAVQNLTARSQKTASPPEKLCFTGILYCGHCGGRMIQHRRQNRPAAYLCAAYRRHGKTACESHHIREDVLLAMAEDLIRPILAKPEAAGCLSERLMAKRVKDPGAEGQIAQYERAISRIYSDMLERPEQIPRELYEKKLAEYTARLRYAQDSLAAANPQIPELAGITRFLTDSGLCRRRGFIHRVFAKVTVYLPDDGIGKGKVVFSAHSSQTCF
ncbi:MAG: zinc ribbon domain-containing protein, partial [Oscillospiraceae bacterium]|nr:zinc ribbon domain-containing protein [Oscillospiraceae bacterium]